MRITIYSTNWCAYCNAAKQLLSTRGFDYEEINLEDINIDSQRSMSKVKSYIKSQKFSFTVLSDPRAELFRKTGGSTVPQIVVDGISIGGFEELQKMDTEGKLHIS